MSQVIEGIRQKYDQYKDIPDDELILKIGSKYPVYLDKDPEFKKEFASVAADRALQIAASGTGRLINILNNPAAGESAESGRYEIAADKEAQEKLKTQQEAAQQTARYVAGGGPMAGMASIPSLAKNPESSFLPEIPDIEAKTPLGQAAAELVNQPKNLVLGAVSPAGVAMASTGPVGAAAGIGMGVAAVKHGIQEVYRGTALGDPKRAVKGAMEAITAGVLTGSGIGGAAEILKPKVSQKPKEWKLPQMSPESRTRMVEESMFPWLSQDQKNTWNALSPEAKRRAAFLGITSHDFDTVVNRAKNETTPPNQTNVRFPTAFPINAQAGEELQKASKQAEDVAPMTAAAVKQQANQPAPPAQPKAAEPKPTNEPETEPVEDLQAQMDEELGQDEPQAKPEKITAASYTNPETGKTTTGENHVAAAKAQDVEAPKIPTDRHGDEFGFEVLNTETGEKRYVSRDEAEDIARESGQLLSEPQRGKLHSDEVEFYKPEEKGNKNAIQQEAGTPVRDVQQSGGTEKGADQVPADEAGKEAGQGGEPVPQEAPELKLPTYPPKPPSTQGLSKAQRNQAYTEHTKLLGDYYAKLKAWEEAQPESKRLIFRSEGGRMLHAITKDPQGGWRVTSFTRLFDDDPRYAPWGHERYATRYEAVRSAARGELVDKLPEIMTEGDISQRNKQNERDRIKYQFHKALSTESMKDDKTAGVNVYSDDRGIHSIGNPQDIFSGGKAPEGLQVSTVGVNGMTAELRLDQSTWGEGVDKAKIIEQLKDAGLKEESPAQSSDAPPQQSAPTAEAETQPEPKQSDDPDLIRARNRLAQLDAEGKGQSDYAFRLKARIAKLEKAASRPPRPSMAGQARKRFDEETKAGNEDILSWMEENMKMLSKSAAKAKLGKEKFEANKSLWEDAATLERPHHNVVFDKNGESPDRVAQSAYEAGMLKEPSVNELHAAMQAASKARAKAFETAKREEAFLAEEAKQHEDWLKATSEGEQRVSADELKVGDTMEVDGERVEVTGIDPDTGDVTLKDGRKFGVQKLSEGQSIHVEKFEESSGEPDFGPPSETDSPQEQKVAEFGDVAEQPKAAAQSKPEPKTKTQERPLTKTEQDEFQDLSIKARRAREEGGPALTTEETRRYDELTGMAGQFELLGENSPSGIRSRLNNLKAKLDQLERLRVRTQDRAFESRHRRNELFKEAVTYDNEAKKVREEIRELEKQLPKEEESKPTVQAQAETPAALKSQNEVPTGTSGRTGEGVGSPTPGETKTTTQDTQSGVSTPPPEVTPQNSPTVLAEPNQKYRLKNSGPQLYTLVERMPATEIEIANGEQPVRVKNEKTGEESVVLEGQLQAIKERTAEQKAASKPMTKKELDDELRRLGMDPSAFTNSAQKREAIRRAKLSGPGTPSLYQGPDPKAQIEQLEESFRNIQGKKVPMMDKVREAFALGEKIAAGKDAVSRAVAGLKSAGDYVIRQWEGYNTLDDLLKAKGELSAELEKRGYRVRQFVKTVMKAIPDKGQRAAIAKWVDAGGDQNELHWGFMQTQPEFRQAYADAMNLSGDALVAAQNIRNFFEARLQEAMDAGVLESGVDDYIHRIYEKDPKAAQQLSAYAQSGILSRNPALARKRIFQLDWEAERLGYRPVQDFLPRITEYETSLSRAIAARNFVKKVVGFTDENGNKVRGLLAPDGRPIIDVAGLGIPIEDEAGIREATLINPSFKPGDRNPLNNRLDYKERPEYSALRKWKWAVLDGDGKPIYVQGNVVIHPKFVERIDALLKPSSLRYTENPVKRGLFRTAIGLGSTVKQTMLDMSGFHQVQIAVHALEHKVLPWKIQKEIDFTDPDVNGLLKGGTTLGGEYRSSHMGEGLVGRSITRAIPGLSNVMETYHNYLFQDFIPRVKMTMALHALERNKARFAKELQSGKLNMDEVYHMTANQANAAFGELNYTMLERSKTMQDLSRIIFLAPDFLEARGRFAAQALTKHGNEQRAALFLGAATMYVLARVGNQMINGQPHMEPENAFSLVVKNKAYSLRTVQGDILHLIEKPVQFWMSRLNPLYGRTLLELATGRDYFGRKRSALEQVWDAVSTAYPVSLRTSQERTLMESLMNGMGLTARRFSDVDTAFKMAQEWKDKHGVKSKGEFIYDANKDDLRPLKLALSNGDDAGAVKEIKRLVDSKKYNLAKLTDYWNKYSAMPFTGSHDNDRKFFKGLTEDQKKTVEAAQQHKKSLRSLYMQARDKYVSALHSKPEPDVAAPSGAQDQSEPAEASPAPQ